MSAEVFGLTQQILMLIPAYINTGVCGKLRLWETTHFFSKTATLIITFDVKNLLYCFSLHVI